jgi:hypothetical protein
MRDAVERLFTWLKSLRKPTIRYKKLVSYSPRGKDLNNFNLV